MWKQRLSFIKRMIKSYVKRVYYLPVYQKRTQNQVKHIRQKCFERNFCKNLHRLDLWLCSEYPSAYLVREYQLISYLSLVSKKLKGIIPIYPADLPHIYELSLRIQCKCGKARTRITPNTGTFYAVPTVSLIILRSWS